MHDHALGTGRHSNTGCQPQALRARPRVERLDTRTGLAVQPLSCCSPTALLLVLNVLKGMQSVQNNLKCISGWHMYTCHDTTHPLRSVTGSRESQPRYPLEPHLADGLLLEGRLLTQANDLPAAAAVGRCTVRAYACACVWACGVQVAWAYRLACCTSSALLHFTRRCEL